MCEWRPGGQIRGILLMGEVMMARTRESESMDDLYLVNSIMS